MLIAATPYDEGKNVGKAYNEFMSRLHEDDWACLRDHDSMFTTKDWHKQITQIISNDPEVGIFVPLTNRIGCNWMVHPTDRKNHDICYHREIGRDLEENNWNLVRDVTVWEDQPSKKPLSGVMMVISKRTWKLVGGFKDGFLTVDNDMHKRVREAGLKVCLMRGVYVYHWYRFQGRES